MTIIILIDRFFISVILYSLLIATNLNNYIHKHKYLLAINQNNLRYVIKLAYLLIQIRKHLTYIRAHKIHKNKHYKIKSEGKPFLKMGIRFLTKSLKKVDTDKKYKFPNKQPVSPRHPKLSFLR